MSAYWALTNVLKMPPALTLKEVMSVPVTWASLEMDSTAQVSDVCTFQMNITFKLPIFQILMNVRVMTTLAALMPTALILSVALPVIVLKDTLGMDRHVMVCFHFLNVTNEHYLLIFHSLDIDECSEMTDMCHPVYGICNNSIGSYDCECKAGFSGDGLNCTGVLLWQVSKK